MRRLRKLSENTKMYENTINQISNKGRNILKLLEDFKFVLEQSAKLLTNNQQIAQALINKRKVIDEISGKLYQVVFDIENIDISNSFFNPNDTILQIPKNNVNETNDLNDQKKLPFELPNNQNENKPEEVKNESKEEKPEESKDKQKETKK